MQLKQFIAFVSIAILASFWLSIAIMTYMAVASPPLVEDNPGFIVISSALTVLAVMALGFPNFAVSEPRANIGSFRRRSGLCRRMSFAMLGIMVMVALMGFTVAVGLDGAEQSSDGAEQSSDGGISRFASFVLLVILMRILALVYRYNLRLASFYDARADYLYLAKSMKELSHKERLEAVGADDLSTTPIREFFYSLMGRSSFQDGRN